MINTIEYMAPSLIFWRRSNDCTNRDYVFWDEDNRGFVLLDSPVVSFKLLLGGISLYFNSDWLKHYHVQLYNYSNIKGRANYRFSFCARLFWLWAIQSVAVLWGISSNAKISQYLLCILIIFATAFLAATTAVFSAVFYREKENKLAGSFRYRSAYCLLIALSHLELVIIVAIKEDVKFVLMYLFPIVLVYCGISLFIIRRRIEKDAFSTMLSNKTTLLFDPSYTLGYLGGFVVYWLCKSYFSEKHATICILVLVEVLIAEALCIAVKYWLKSVGAQVK